MNETEFNTAFTALTGNLPFPWQWELYDTWFRDGKFPPSCNLPTGLGKTSVVAIWLIALANHPDTVPRRLVYVVNRRTVVDQTTNEVEKLRSNLLNRSELGELKEKFGSLALSTLRGQFADNREWAADPSRPAVICGTVDMIGSRLLFSGYGCGFKSRPLHAGFLGQDVLLVHDEAHLEPAFQTLIEAIRNEQMKEPAPLGEQMRLKVMELTATSHGSEEPFELTDREKSPENLPAKLTDPIHYVWQRLQSKKGIAFHQPESDKRKVADRISKLAEKYSESHPGSAVLVFVNSLEDHATVCKALNGKQVQVLTGTLRGLERDRMADPRKKTGCPIFARFLKPPKPDDDEKEQWKITPKPGTVYLVCTSAGEVGIDISADHMVCDLSTFDRMAQRFGRVNRFGTGDANIDIVHEATPDKKKEDDPNEQARWKTLELLKELPQIGERRSASPLALMHLRWREDLKPKFESAYTPQPTILPVSGILFDAWAFTTIRDKLPGRPTVEPYLHGLSGSESPETQVAWREEVGVITGELLEQYQPEDLLQDYPLKPQEMLRDNTFRKNTGVQATLAKLAEKQGHLPVWIQEAGGGVSVMTLADLAEAELANRTVILSPQAGGLTNGMLAADALPTADGSEDVADEWRDQTGQRRRRRIWNNKEPKPQNMQLEYEIVFGGEDELSETGGEDKAARFWRWYVRPKSAEPGASAPVEQELREHLDKAKQHATHIATALRLPEPFHTAVVLAAKWHDVGKDRKQWQQAYGNRDYPDKKIAKSGHRRPPENLDHFRHEFGSVIDVLSKEPEFAEQKSETRELILHLIAAHHGRARPHFPAVEVFDPDNTEAMWNEVARETPGRFARLQRMCGRWGLAYLESLVRAADVLASPDDKKGGAK